MEKPDITENHKVETRITKRENILISLINSMPIQFQYEVDLIKKRFGWSEHEILSLPTERRKSYVSILEKAGKCQ